MKTYPYPNHYEMKQNRLKKFKEMKGKCEVCSQEAHEVHHIDEDRENHSLENLAVLCKKCHITIHRGRYRPTSRYLRIYGISIKEIMNKFGGTSSTYSQMHKKGTLKHFLETEPPLNA